MTTGKRPQDAERVRSMVSEGYAKIVNEHGSDEDARAREVAERIGYSEADLDAVPEGANLGVGCGNPTAIDRLQQGETVLDLGSGAGFDALLAARQVGPSGHVIGVDMTDAMLERARENARKAGADQVEFRKGQIESLPVEDGSVDAIISNCVINLSPEKERVYGEAWRVLRPGGRIMISDIVLERELPAAVLDSIDAYIGCVGGASLRADYLETITKAGFSEVRIDREASFATAFDVEDPRVREIMEKLEISEEDAKGYADAVTSLQIYARK